MFFAHLDVAASTFSGMRNGRTLCPHAAVSADNCSRDGGDILQMSARAIRTQATHVISGITFYYQDRPLSCEEASTSMALTHQGIYLSQDQILADIGADRRRMYVDEASRVRWANPYETFVGNVDGSESNYTGYGTFYPPLVRVAAAHGAVILSYGSMSAARIYASVLADHPVVAFATWDWQWHPRHDYLSFDGNWIPWIGPTYASHVYVVVGVSPSQVLVNDPIRGQYWINKAAFEAGYSDFNEAIVFA
ncbi:MAG TPA: C39 family peptidase [Candidatus Dormibacteraeota bacterium]|nr:C39 family peptidase [Candidatus Dormibacteraeota bacterium]